MNSSSMRPSKCCVREHRLSASIAFGASGQMLRLVKTGRLTIAKNSMSKVS